MESIGITDLPDDFLRHIAKFMVPKYAIHLARTCRHLRDLIRVRRVLLVFGCGWLFKETYKLTDDGLGWISLPRMHTPYGANMAAVVYDADRHHIYVISSLRVNRCEILNGQWIQCDIALTPCKFKTGCVVSGNQLVASAGVDGPWRGQQRCYTTSLPIQLNPPVPAAYNADQVWRPVCAFPTDSLCTLNGLVYAHRDGKLAIFDPRIGDASRQLIEMPWNIVEFCLCAFRGFIYAASGKLPITERCEYSKHMYRFNPRTGDWAQLAPLQRTRGLVHAFVEHLNRLWLVSTSSDRPWNISEYTRSRMQVMVDSYDVEMDRWIEEPSLPCLAAFDVRALSVPVVDC